jgi:glutamate-1-semialdehyde 2,1-aminomutase
MARIQTESILISGREKSKALHKKALELFPGGVNSPVRAFVNLAIDPLFAASAFGDQLFDADNLSYIDFCMSFGALILGHAHPSVTAAIARQAGLGSSFCATTEYEVALGEQICTHMPSIEKMRFVSSGTEATMTAIRLARAFTGRKKIIKFNGHYHGHSDSLLVQAGSGVAHLPAATSSGVPQEAIAQTVSLPFNDIEAVRAQSEAAAVIVEPVCGNYGVLLPEPHFLKALCEETKKMGALLIFDEVITGFRLGLKGAQGLYGIVADLTCLGKIIGGGVPAAAVGGRGDIMDLLAPLGPVYQAGTLSGNPLAMAAGAVVMQEIAQEGFYEMLQRKTDLFCAPIEALIQKRALPLSLPRIASMLSLNFSDPKMFGKFFRFLFEQGIYIPPSPYESWFISAAHTNTHLEYVQEKIIAFLNDYY